VVETIWCDAGRTVDLRALLADRGWTRAFLKPAVGATSRETFRVRGAGDLDDAQAHLDRLLPDEQMLVQPYLASVEREGELSAIFVDGSVTHTVRKIPVPGDYRTQDDFGGHDEPHELAASELQLARDIVGGVEGADLLYARTDFLRDDDGNLRLTELELVEPSMFFRHGPHAARRLAEAIVTRVASVGRNV
jgi:glutathione synthase/RimK-type ligase-like ATP-grasp enzyme